MFAATCTVCVGIFCPVAVGGESAFLETTNLEMAVLSFPDLSADKYRPDTAARSANILIAAGRDAAMVAIDSMIRTNRSFSTNQDFKKDNLLNDRLCHLIRLLFVATNHDNPLRPPRIGLFAALPVLTMKPADWPDLPFFMTNNIPLSFNLGYNRSGIPEDAGNYFEYCRSNGTFRRELFSEPTFITESNSLAQVFASTAWKSLKWTDRQFGFSYNLNQDLVESELWRQVGNPSATTLNAGTVRAADRAVSLQTNSASSQQAGMTPRQFREIISLPGDAVPLVSQLAAVPFWTNAVISNVMTYASGRVFHEEMTLTARTVGGKYVVFTVFSKYYKQFVSSILTYDETAAALKEYGLFGDGHGGDILTEGMPVYDYAKKTYTITSSYGDGFNEITTGSYTEREDSARTEVYKDGVLSMRRDVMTRPVEKK